MWRSSGTTCAARGCTHNWLKLKNWMKSECFDHRPKTKKECSCPQWYSFHRLPKDNLARANWLKNLRLRKPPKMLHVCSFHFVDKRPTDDNPYPTLFLGSEDPPAERRPRLGTVPGRQSHGSKTKLLLDSTTSDRKLGKHFQLLFAVNSTCTLALSILLLVHLHKVEK